MAARAACTSSDLTSVLPAGRSPISLASTVTLPSLVERAKFSPSAASWTILSNRSSTRLSSVTDSERMSTSIQLSTGIELTDVPPPIRPML